MNKVTKWILSNILEVMVLGGLCAVFIWGQGQDHHKVKNLKCTKGATRFVYPLHLGLRIQ